MIATKKPNTLLSYPEFLNTDLANTEKRIGKVKLLIKGNMDQMLTLKKRLAYVDSMLRQYRAELSNLYEKVKDFRKVE